MKLSLIVPCYNEAENIRPFYDAVVTAFEGCNYDYEIVYVDDGSRDATLHNLKKLYREETGHIKIISFSRNFGKEAGLYAGLEYASGEYISLIDADLQQRPEIIRDMVAFLDGNPDYDVVAAYQDRRSEGKALSFFKRCFYGVINSLSDVKLHRDASDFRTFRKSVAESILKMGEYHRFSKGIFSWVGYKTHYIPYVACKRTAGLTKWSFRKLMNYGIDGIIGFSIKPLKLATYLGSITGIAALIYLLVVVFQRIFNQIGIPGYATTIVLILFLGSMQLFCIGIIGEYVGRIFQQSKNRPIYLAKEIISEEGSE